ncbi:MAG: isoleucine--tRNA ligase [Armatimonadetes bacterium]|nr:isoleucine--tRNA ligase [Armatimonadota bacterium]
MFEPVGTDVRFPEMEKKILAFWKERDIFRKSVEHRQGRPDYVFYEGPPTANGRPGVHHVQARAYKDLFPRYKTMRGYRVPRKAGWDCHGLPVEIEVEKKLGFSGKKAIEDFGIEPFNRMCRESVMEYEGPWREMTDRIGFWVDLDDAYMTMSNDFVESVWWSLKELWRKGLLYKGYKVVPYCAADGTPLSSHEVGLGYQDVKDPSIYVRFPLKNPAGLGLPEGAALLVWTTTPWTLPGNTAAAVQPELKYAAVRHQDEVLVLAETLLQAALQVETAPEVLKTFTGRELVGARYQAPYVCFQYDKEPHRVVPGAFVTAEDGTGIVHIAPAFGADDLQMSREHDLPVIHSVDSTGHFLPEVELVAGKWFKDADPIIIRDLKQRGILFRKADYEHSYPHCWRCSRPLMYYATDSWFIRNTSLKDRLIEKNQEIDWHPAHIKTGRYGDWLNNLVDWALSRTRYWGTPLPIWECPSCEHHEAIGSFAELSERSLEPLDPESFDPHRPYVDRVRIRCSSCGGEAVRVSEVIDCWYDSGAMPFAQFHYPFENRERFEAAFPADFIAEGLDQTRGWFNSLHQLGVMLFDSIAYKTVICHGLVLDAQGEKMSKRLGNLVDPWDVLNVYGADALRWYLYASAPPELSRRFSLDLVGEAARRYLNTLWNTYHFFVLNSNASRPDLDTPADRQDLDRWVLSRLHRTLQEVTERMDAYELTPAARAIQDFVDDLSNWYVRRSRRRFWAVEPAAFQTLRECLLTVARMSAPFTPFLSEEIYRNLKHPGSPESVHLTDWPELDGSLIDPALNEDGAIAEKVVSLGRAARNASGHRVRQPLREVLVRVRTQREREGCERFADEILDELNCKTIRFLAPGEEFLDYTLKPNLRLVGKKYGPRVPGLRKALEEGDGKEVARRARAGEAIPIAVDGETLNLLPEEVLVEARSPEGFEAVEEAGLMVAMATTVTRELRLEGIARDLVRHIQELRKSTGLEITDRIHVWIAASGEVAVAIEVHRQTLMDETLAVELTVGEPPPEASASGVSLDKDTPEFRIGLRKVGRESLARSQE